MEPTHTRERVNVSELNWGKNLCTVICDSHDRTQTPLSTCKQVKRKTRGLHGFSEEYLPLRRPRGNSPTVWESVRSKPTPFALITLGLWPNWRKKTESFQITSLPTSLPCKAARRPNQGPPPHTTPDDDCHDNTRAMLPLRHPRKKNHAPHGFPHKDWHHSCACMTSCAEARRVLGGVLRQGGKKKKKKKWRVLNWHAHGAHARLTIYNVLDNLLGPSKVNCINSWDRL